jgi:hypothetical protein
MTPQPPGGSSATIELMAGDGSFLWRDELEMDE